MSPGDKESSLTAREVEILSALSSGLKAAEIAEKFEITVPTVALHLKNARRKLGARTREHAVAVAIRKKYLGE